MESSGRLPPVHTVTSLPAPATCTIRPTNVPKLPAYTKMEGLVREMQDAETGIPIRSQKLFLTSIPSAFMGYDLIEWLMERLDIEDSSEAIHLANLLCQFGYFFPVGESRSLIVKDDSSLYRFQTPYYWPSQNHNADTTDYAIYLTKRLARNKQKHGLEEYELETYTKLKKGLQHKWDFVTLQAEEQMRLAKDRKKGDKIVTDSQERAYWRVYRPPQGFTNCLEVAPVPDKTNMANRVRKKSAEELQQEIDFLTESVDRTRSKVSIISEALITHWEVFNDYDPFLCPPNPSNPWVSEEEEYWLINDDNGEFPSERRAKRWSINFWELISDPLGLSEFTNYMRKEYAHENIRFWQAVTDLRFGTSSAVKETVESIFEEFLKPGAPCEINIDGKTMEETQQLRKQPTRYTYDLAAEHVYELNLKKDCYPRFLRSEDYKNLVATALQPSTKRQRFFHIKTGPGKKKTSTITTSNCLPLVAVTPQPIKRLGSDETTGMGGRPPPFDDPGGGIHMGISGTTPTPPLSSHKVDCGDSPYSSDAQELGQSAVCPWETATNSNICPWENTDPPATTASSTAPSTSRQLSQTQSGSQLQTQQSFRLEGNASGSGKGKPPDRSVSVDVSSLSSRKKCSVPLPLSTTTLSGAPLPSHLASSSSESKVTLNICPGEEQELPQKQQDKTQSVDTVVSYAVSTDRLAKKGSSTTSIPNIVGGSQELPGDKSPSVSVRSYHERRPSMHLDKKTSMGMFQEEPASYSSPSISLQDLTASKSHQQLSLSELVTGKHHQRISSDISNVKISIDSSMDFMVKPFHRELSASVSVPCTSLTSQQQSTLDYSVKSGHLPGQYGIQGSSTSDGIAHTKVSSAGIVMQTSIHPPIENKKEKLSATASVPCTQMMVQRSETPRTVSVSSQTQTDPLVHHTTNQQTQYPARDYLKFSNKSSYRHSKQATTTGQYATDFCRPSYHKGRQQYHQSQSYVMTSSAEQRGKQQSSRQQTFAQTGDRHPAFDQQTRQYYITRESGDQPPQTKVATHHHALQHQDELNNQQKFQLEQSVQQQKERKQQYEYDMKQKSYEKHRQQYDQQMQEFQEQQTRYQEKRVQELASMQQDMSQRDSEKHSPFLVCESEDAVSFPPASSNTKVASDSGAGGHVSPPAVAKSMQTPQQPQTSTAHQQPQIVSTSQQQHLQTCSTNKSYQQPPRSSSDNQDAQMLKPTASMSPKVEEKQKEVWDDPSDICPWEDEESCIVDGPSFVKTYETLGYL